MNSHNIVQKSYLELKEYYDKVLNVDKSTYKSSNDEPTPISCVEDMMDAIPKYFWGKKDLKILDPCCGNGNFHLVVVNKLKEHHTLKQIIEDMIYFNDVNTERLDIVKSIFCSEQFRLNLTCEDFLTTTKYENTLFDAIVANPPFAKFDENGKRTSKNHNLIKVFLQKSLSLLKPNGFIVFITPDNWMSFADRNTIIRTLTSLQIIHLNIHIPKKYFKKIGSSFTWYIVENTTSYKDVYIEGIYKNSLYDSYVPSIERNYIPLFYNKTVYSILSKTIDCKLHPKFQIETSSNLHKYTKKNLIQDKKDDTFKYRLIHTPKQTVWSSRPHIYQDGYKVFLSTTDKYSIFIDDCGMTQSIAFIRCISKDEAEEIGNILKHPIYVFLNNICRWGNFNNIRILQNFPKPLNKNDIYGSFNITNDEQGMIELYYSK